MKPTRSNRTRDYYRHHRQRVINRKKRLIKQLHWHVQHNQFGRLSKAKIHCSCWMCSKKSLMLGLPKSEEARIEGFRDQIMRYSKENQ